MFVISLILIFIESVFIKEGIKIISSPEYLMAYSIVPILCLAQYFSMLMYFVQFGILIRKQTKYIAYSTIIAVVSSVGLNFLLVPRFGMYGAGAAMLIAFFVRFFVVYKWSQGLYPVPYSWGRLVALVAFSAVLLIISNAIAVDGLVLGLVKDTIVVVLYLSLIFLFWLNKAERERLFELVKNPRKAFVALAR
jgi:O-antigen/teichoic acid export membrane protein